MKQSHSSFAHELQRRMIPADLSITRVMGVVNITPDSYCEVGRFLDVDSALKHAIQLIKDGAAIIDVGGESTRPGMQGTLSVQQELDRVIPVIEAMIHEFDVPVSIDTSQPEMMREAAAVGVRFINDVRALQMPEALTTAAELGLPVCLMHMSYPFGKPNNAQDPLAENPIETIIQFLQTRIDACLEAGIPLEKILIDPGIGAGTFGKSLEQNLIILARLAELQVLGLPIVIGASRKTFIGELLDQAVTERLPASLAAATIAVMNGANIIRTHDVKATVGAVRLAAHVNQVNK